jgi:predicted O-methyltransferase YrrM
MKKRLLETKLGQSVYGLREKFYWGPKLGPGIAQVDVSRFGANQNTDISDHLNLLSMCLELSQPQHVLELGTRGGESTRVLHEYCVRRKIVGRSVDLSYAPEWLTSSSNWHHYAEDDISLGKSLSNSHIWPDGSPYFPIEFLFLDTSHEYEHTLQELEIYVPLLSHNGVMALHDTNLKSYPHRRIDGSIGYGWNNQRGVMRAIEDFFGILLDEKTFQSVSNVNSIDYLIHFPWNNGLTILKIKK